MNEECDPSNIAEILDLNCPIALCKMLNQKSVNTAETLQFSRSKFKTSLDAVRPLGNETNECSTSI